MDIEAYRLNIEQLAEYADIAIQIRQKIDAQADVVENLIQEVIAKEDNLKKHNNIKLTK